MLTRLLIFLSVFLGLYGGLHVYLWSKLRGVVTLSPAGTGGIIVLLVGLVAAPVLVHVCERQGWTSCAAGVAQVGYIWMGLVLLAVSLFFAYDLYRWAIAGIQLLSHGNLVLLLAPRRTVFVVVWLAAGGITGYGWFAARQVCIEHLTVTTTKLPAGSGPYKLAMVSDVHLGIMVRAAWLEQVIAAIEQEQPDVLLCAGDMVDQDPTGCDHLKEYWQKLKPRYGKFAVTGNHEMFTGLERSLAYLRDLGFTVLRHESCEAATGLVLAGVDDRAGRMMQLIPVRSDREVLEQLPRDKFIIFLKHTPQVEPGTAGMFDLMLSGHTHQGQIFPFTIFVRMAFKYLGGWYSLGDGSNLYVSRGTGTWGPPLRVLAAPEVTIITIKRP
jgi:predicted MPP superfamily phosphohydrolase